MTKYIKLNDLEDRLQLWINATIENRKSYDELWEKANNKGFVDLIDKYESKYVLETEKLRTLEQVLEMIKNY